VRPAYVEEAARLLRKSIIHVETEDIVLADAPGVTLETRRTNKENEQGDNNNNVTKAKEAKAKPVLSISFEKYKRIANLIVMHLRRNEAVESSGMRQKDLVAWYLEQNEELNNEDDVKREAKIVRHVLQRLVSKDRVLLELTSASSRDDRFLAVHPNYELS
jgi:DNA replication licensing factor MCM6